MDTPLPAIAYLAISPYADSSTGGGVTVFDLLAIPAEFHDHRFDEILVDSRLRREGFEIVTDRAAWKERNAEQADYDRQRWKAADGPLWSGPLDDEATLVQGKWLVLADRVPGTKRWGMTIYEGEEVHFTAAEQEGVIEGASMVRTLAEAILRAAGAVTLHEPNTYQELLFYNMLKVMVVRDEGRAEVPDAEVYRLSVDNLRVIREAEEERHVLIIERP